MLPLHLPSAPVSRPPPPLPRYDLLTRLTHTHAPKVKAIAERFPLLQRDAGKPTAPVN